MDQDIGVTSDGRGEVGVERNVEGVVMVVVALVHPGTEIPGELHRLGQQAGHTGQGLLISSLLNLVDTPGQGRGGETLGSKI